MYTIGASADGMGSIQTLKNDPSWLTAQYVIWAPAEMYKILVIEKNPKPVYIFLLRKLNLN